MKAVQIIKPGEVKLIELPEPKPQFGEVLIRNRFVSLCGSDLNTYLGRNPLVKFPVIPGHEISGVIEELGEGVPEHIEEGSSCTVIPYTNCGCCHACRNRRPNACQYNQTLGVQRDGGLCEYIVAPWQKVIVDDDMGYRELALVEPLSVGFHAVERAKVIDNEIVMVIGCGVVGVGAILRSLQRGAIVVAVDVEPYKLSYVHRLGAQFDINTRSEDINALMQKIAPNGVDVVIEAAGRPETYRMAIEHVAFTGRVVYISYASEEVSFATKDFVMKELDIRGSRNALPEDFHAVIKCMMRRGREWHTLAGTLYSIVSVKDALENWKNKPGKVFRPMIMF
ncbi:MAG: alcohol dehydrogenase catalytic domain-containing protein [Prevotellaceae bacterium]|nr:alcohol dehydrogenase catalytic domain-containing protein [Prevotellaceae bacterium]